MAGEYHVSIDGKRYGPYPAASLDAYRRDGRLPAGTLVWREGWAGWVAIEDVAGHESGRALAESRGEAATLENIARYERLACVLWLVLAILQILSVVAIIAGLWNLFAVFSRRNLPRMIRARDPSIPSIYEPITGLVVIAIINLVFGAVIGVVFVVLDAFVRQLVLGNRHLFEGGGEEVAAAKAGQLATT